MNTIADDIVILASQLKQIETYLPPGKSFLGIPRKDRNAPLATKITHLHTEIQAAVKELDRRHYAPIRSRLAELDGKVSEMLKDLGVYPERDVWLGRRIDFYLGKANNIPESMRDTFPEELLDGHPRGRLYPSCMCSYDSDEGMPICDCAEKGNMRWSACYRMDWAEYPSAKVLEIHLGESVNAVLLPLYSELLATRAEVKAIEVQAARIVGSAQNQVKALSGIIETLGKESKWAAYIDMAHTTHVATSAADLMALTHVHNKIVESLARIGCELEGVAEVAKLSAA